MTFASVLGVNVSLKQHILFEGEVMRICNLNTPYSSVVLSIAVHQVYGTDQVGTTYISKDTDVASIEKSGDTYQHAKFYRGQDDSYIYVKATMSTGRIIIGCITNDYSELKFEKVNIDVSTLYELT